MLDQIEVIYENDDLLVVNKPAGLLVHKTENKDGEYTISDWFIDRYPKALRVGESTRPGVVHRLDKDTSGTLVLAKNNLIFDDLKRQFHDHLIKKEYRAIVYGVFKEESGIIERPIGRSRRDPRIRTADKGAVGRLREAITRYEVLERFKDYSYISVQPQTGRTHQIRVHLKLISKPIVCDFLYAPNRPCLPGLNRQALHAHKLIINYQDNILELKSPLPDDFKQALDYLRLA